MLLVASQGLPRFTSPTTVARGSQNIPYAIMFPSGGTHDFWYKTLTALNGTGTYSYSGVKNIKNDRKSVQIANNIFHFFPQFYNLLGYFYIFIDFLYIF